MDNQALYQYYEFAVLPQFGFGPGGGFSWRKSVDIGPDETAHYFTRANEEVSSDYVLIYEDYQGLGRSEAYIRESIDMAGREFEYIHPTSSTHISPSYNISLPVLSKAVHNVFGSFTVIRLTA